MQWVHIGVSGLLVHAVYLGGVFIAIKQGLPAGITAVHGEFLAGEPVRLLDLAGAVIARGIVNYDATELPGILGRSTHELVAELGAGFDRTLVHRDELIVKSGARSVT